MYTVKPVRLHIFLLCSLVYIVHFSMHQLKEKAVFTPLYFAHLPTHFTLYRGREKYTGFTLIRVCNNFTV